MDYVNVVNLNLKKKLERGIKFKFQQKIEIQTNSKLTSKYISAMISSYYLKYKLMPTFTHNDILFRITMTAEIMIQIVGIVIKITIS